MHLPHKGIPPLLTLSKPMQTSRTPAIASACYKPLISKVVFTPAKAQRAFYL